VLLACAARSLPRRQAWAWAGLCVLCVVPRCRLPRLSLGSGHVIEDQLAPSARSSVVPCRQREEPWWRDRYGGAGVCWRGGPRRTDFDDAFSGGLLRARAGALDGDGFYSRDIGHSGGGAPRVAKRRWVVGRRNFHR